MTRELEIQFQERSIGVLLSQMDKIFNLLKNSEETPLIDPDFSPKEIILEKRKEFEYIADRIYNLCIAYLELRNLSIYIEKFDKRILPLYENRDELSNISVNNIYDEEESLLTKTYREFLYSFRAFGGGEEKHLTGLDYLVNILKATNHILNEKGSKPSKESEVYNSVKIVCDVTFPKAQFDGGLHPFYTNAKCYKPDILIPSLHCAVEYKFAKTEKVLVKTIEEILIDVKGYSGHPIYKFFYAVFYVKTGIITENRFKEIWKEKNFPENWKEIFVEGEVSP